MNSFFRYAVKGNLVLTILMIAVVCVMGFFIIGDINNMLEAKNNMQGANSGYEYSKNLCNLVDNVSRCYFMCIFILMIYLTYVKKQYSKWTIRLFYVLGVSSIFYFVVAGHVFDYVFNHVESIYMYKLPSLARTVFTGPVYWIIIDYFFIPKILKDAQKLKEEQELTI